MRLILRTVGAMALLGSAATPAQKIEFNRDIRPIVSDKCFTCHGPDAAHRKTKLRFDIESGALIELPGGKHAIVPGDPDKSEMYLRISSTDKNRRMPPAYMGHERLTDREIQLIRDWIAQGAPWSPFWSFAPPKRPPLPTVQTPGWVKTPIDAFILNRLEREVLHPSPEADKATLIRRVSLDLTGLPPTPERSMHFWPTIRQTPTKRWSTGCWRRRDMASAWRRWLDAARYADTNGYQTDGPRDMWRWRDWVIDAFNRNMPLRSVHDRADRRRPAAERDTRPENRHRVQSQPSHQRRRRHHRRKSIAVEYVADRVRDHFHRLAGTDDGLRALPRPQVRSDSHRRSFTDSSPTSTTCP